MRSPLKLALLIALPLEGVNFCLLSYRIPEPLPHHFFAKLLAVQWLVLHWLGVLILNALYRMGSSAVWELLIFVICGYLETVLLVAAILFVVRALKHRHARHPAIHS